MMTAPNWHINSYIDGNSYWNYIFIFVALLALAYVWLIVFSLIKVDWRNRWKNYITEFVIVYLALWVLVTYLNPRCIELQQTVGWTRQTFEQITYVSILAFLVLLPFINIRNAKWNSLINVKKLDFVDEKICIIQFFVISLHRKSLIQK